MKLSLENYKKAARKARRRYRETKQVRGTYLLERTARELSRVVGRDIAYRNIVLPPRHEHADVALTGAPREMSAAAERINEGKSELLEQAYAVGPFLNVTLRGEKLYGDVLHEVREGHERYGSHNAGSGRLVVIDYSSANIAKPIGVGHLRSTIIGESLARIYEYQGYAVMRDNYLGDWGQQFGKLITAYRKWGNPADTSVETLKDLYVRFERESSDDKALEEEARECFKKLEEGDRKLVALWKKFRDISIGEFEKTYKTFDVTFDVYGGESFFADRARAVIAQCLADKVCNANEDSAVVVDIEGLPTFLLRRSDGATLYHARDLAQLAFRFRELEAEQVLYVVGNEQRLHFKQLFALAKRLGVAETARALHIGFGLVLGDDGKRMSTRKGTAIELDELVRKAIGAAGDILRAKAPERARSERELVAKQVGIGAVVYNDLRQSREKDIRFDWKRMLDVEGGSAVYLQYTAARIRSLMEKVKASGGGEAYRYETPEEHALALLLAWFPKVVSQACGENAPHLIATYLEELAAAFNLFYNKISVSETGDERLKASRLALTDAVGQVLGNGLELLNVPVPERL